MWPLIAQQLSYHRRGLIFVASFAGLLALGAGAGAELAERLRAIWFFVAVVLGGGGNLYLWSADQRERRMLLWASVPLTPRQVAAARLISSLLVQGIVSLLAAVGLLGMSAAKGLLDTENAILGLLAILGGQGVGLLSIAYVHFHEEINLHFSDSRVAVLTINVLSMVFFAVLAFFAAGKLPSLESLWMIAGSHTLAAIAASCAFALFVRRRNQLMGVDACWGTPRDWSGTASRAT